MTLTEVAGRLRQMLWPTFEQLRELRKPGVFKTDLMAGITVALVLVPQSMAYAQLAGLPAYYGLYASFLPPMVAALLGSSRQLATGPVAVVSLLTAASLEPLATFGSEGFLAYAIVLAFMVGAFQLALGVFRLGVLVDFLSHPVVLGFTNAAAIVIATSQFGKLFGVDVEKQHFHFDTLYRMMEAAFHHTHWPTFVFAVVSFSLIVGVKKWFPKAPAVLVAVVFTTLASWAVGFEQKGGAVVGAIPAGLPAFSVPDFEWHIVQELVTAAIVISLIGFMEAISIAKVMAAETRQRLDANQELVGQGLANFASGFSGGYPVSGSFSRSAVNFEAGAQTGFASIVSGAVVGLTLLFLTPLLYHLPQATLAAVIIVAVVNLVRIEPMRHIWRVERHDGIVAVVTMLLTLALAPHLENGIIVGVILSMVLFIYRTMRPRIAVLSRYHDGTMRDVSVHPELEQCPKILLFRFDMSLYFANAGFFETQVLALVADNPEVEVLILDAEGINTLDASGEEVLRHLSERLEKAGVKFVVARMKKQFMDALRNGGALDAMGGDNERFYSRITFALAYAWRNIECSRCGNGRHCPLRSSVARRQAAARGEIETSE